MTELDDIVELEEFEPIDIDAVIADELGAQPPANVPDWLESGTVIVDGAKFTLVEPSIGIVLRIINCLGRVGLRAERVAVQSLIGILRDEAGNLLRGDKGKIEPALRAILFGALAVLTEDDLYRLGAAVLQYEDERAGRKWLQEHGLALSPIVRALFINIVKSRDLQESLADFFGGLGAVGNVLGGLNLL